MPKGMKGNGRHRAFRPKYKSNPLLPCQRRDGFGPFIEDAVSGNLFSKDFAVAGLYGLTDSRDGDTTDTDWDQHEMSYNNVLRPPL